VLTDYIQAAMKQAVIEYDTDDQMWYGEIPPCRGVIGVGESEAECRQNTREVLEDWIILGLRLGHTLPVIDGINVNPSLEPA
jgi:predicted RNase H-like HicB family nuclease